eukprot:CAMPEP_0197939230 /NCGR_PEP_ID=MMETSP1439-20131203/119381_1 /TAXON_ID=66791 /ORGANISM="Gonyaulax spinifera, Strain CCMP409" /LENGTH=45 /DNA_ID= /DNA_START= /DNA_END= /DNA_ORIENTATION=
MSRFPSFETSMCSGARSPDRDCTSPVAQSTTCGEYLPRTSTSGRH